MPKPFHQLTVDEFADLLSDFAFTRTITSVHMHHTWRPTGAQYTGLSTIEGMWAYHTENNGWSDIAQHVTVAPDGTIWTGRDWNRAPASASGYNGNSHSGPFMFETIGDFDIGREHLAGAQRRAVLEVIARVQMRFGLPVESLRFHNQMSPKSCPGTSVDYQAFLDEVRAVRDELSQHDASASREAPRPFDADATESRQRVLRALADLGRNGGAPSELHDAEPAESSEYRARASTHGAQRGGADLTPEELSALRPHVVNLNQGQFSSTGAFSTSRGDVDFIFDHHLPGALAAAASRGDVLRIVFFAHGGLVDEMSGLRIARKHVSWWLRNNVYPIYFVWETGLFETLGQLLSGARTRALAPRDFWDHTFDPVVERFVRQFGGPMIWSGMKASARQAVEDGGGALYVAQRLKQFCDAHGASVELHAGGHSAGSIFHAHFVPKALDIGVPRFRSLHLLAPAARTRQFVNRLEPRISQGVDHVTMYTMNKDLERADDCARVYHKSLLYLIYHALENEPETPILGLQESVLDDPALRQLFRPAGTPGAAAEVVWSETSVSTGRSASASHTHGGFDDDKPTMESMLRRVLGRGDTDPVEPFVPEVAPRFAETWIRPGIVRPAAPIPTPSRPAAAAAPTNGASPAHGARVALCVGIDRYQTAPLNGCVADAKAWASALGQLGFETRTLLDSAATRGAILERLSAMIRSSTPGDVVVFQFSGHGTELVDTNGDDWAGNNPGMDEAIVPYDYLSGAFVIDDDLGEIFNAIPEGVNVTCFIDCCHSGTINRVGIGVTQNGQPAGDRRPRFVVATPDMQAAHDRFRRASGGSRAIAPAGSPGPRDMREVLFSACLDHEVAWETNGHGDFTERATRLLASSAGSTTNATFGQRVVEAFGAQPRQHPELTCADELRDLSLLAPVGNRPAPASGPPAASGLRPPYVADAAIANALHAIADVLAARK